MVGTRQRELGIEEFERAKKNANRESDDIARISEIICFDKASCFEVNFWPNVLTQKACVIRLMRKFLQQFGTMSVMTSY